MKLSRRSALATLIAATAAGLTYTIFPRSRQQRARHILPSVTADSLSLSVSLQKPSAALVLLVDGSDHAGRQTDTEGRFWSFVVDGLRPATQYQLQLTENGAVIEDHWPLKTFPAWDAMPSKLSLMAYTCAGGGDGFGLGSRQFFKPHSFRQKLFAQGLAQNPDAAVAIGDHIYFDLPSIATLFGYCLGGGLELPLACHFRLAADEGAQIGLPEMDLGTVPAWGGSARLPRVVGRGVALDMILRGRMISGEEALHTGLVMETCPVTKIKARAQSLGEELAKQPRLAVKGGARYNRWF